MDINHIEIPSALVVDLYHHSLVQTGDVPAKAATIANAVAIEEPELKVTPAKAMQATTKPGTFKSLGENNKYVLVIVKSEEAVHLPDEQLQFLTTMLGACKLSLADVAIVNLLHQPTQMYRELITHFKSRSVLLFDVEPAAFGLPMNFPHYQIQPFSNCSFLYAPSLSKLETDTEEKRKLWGCLKRLFNV